MSLYGDRTKWPSPSGACRSPRLRTTRRGGERERERVARQHHQQNKQADRLFGCAAHQLGYIHDRCSFDLDPAAPGSDRTSLALELGQNLSLVTALVDQGFTRLALCPDRLKRAGGPPTLDHFRDRRVDLAKAAVEIGDRLRLNLGPGSERGGFSFDR